MRFLKWLNRNEPSDQRQKFEDTDEGKEFIEKYKASCEKRRLLKEEWERTTPQEKKDQVKLFDIIFPIFFFGYLAALIWGLKSEKELYVLCFEGCISLVSLILFFIKPKFVKYPNCFMMPVIAIGAVVFMYFYLEVFFGFSAFSKQTTDDGINFEKVEKEETFEIDEELLKSNLDSREYIEDSEKYGREFYE